MTVFKEGQTVFVKNSGKNQPVRVFIVVAVYFKITHCKTHTTINQKFIHQIPSFSATALLFSTKNSSLWEAQGHRFTSVSWSSNPSGPWLGSRLALFSFPLHGSPDPRLSRLQIYGPQPYYHRNPTAIWKEFKII